MSTPLKVNITAVRPGDRVSVEKGTGHFVGVIADDYGYLIDIEDRTCVFITRAELHIAYQTRERIEREKNADETRSVAEQRGHGW